MRFLVKPFVQKAAVALFVLSLSCAGPVLAHTDRQVSNAHGDELDEFTLQDRWSTATPSDQPPEDSIHTLVQVREFTLSDHLYIRYDQYFKDLPVIGRGLVAQYPLNRTGSEEQARSSALFSGKIARKLNVSIPERYLTDAFEQEITTQATTDFTKKVGKVATFQQTDSQAVIWITERGKAKLAYRVQFKAQLQEKGAPLWPHYVIAADSGKVLEYWNNIHGSYDVQGPGGNEKTGQYTYGSPPVPALQTTLANERCILMNASVSVSSLQGGWSVPTPAPPVQFPCDANVGESVNGGWAPANDAWIFANQVVDMYREWYSLPVLAHSNGVAKTVSVLVNAGREYENAFWDGKYVVFGDGGKSYHPLVSIALVAHELSHAFTSQHAQLLYANQSGAINEAFSDMAAIAAEYYFRQLNPEAYQTLFGSSAINWLIGDRIAKGNYAMRSMDNPSAYSSAECETPVSGCKRSWNDVVVAARQISQAHRQSYIVHKGSGIMNRAFVHLVGQLGGRIDQAFALMVRANTLYWTSTSTFAEAACGVRQAAQDLDIDIDKVSRSFADVGVSPSC